MVSRKAAPFIVAAVFTGTAPLAAPETAVAVSPAVHRDGAHDFDSEFGRWTIHTSRLMHPLSGANDWVSYDGIKTVTPIWAGKANVAEVTEDGAAGHLEFIALRLYNPAARQWNLNFASAGVGTFSTPLYGEFRNGGVEFIGSDTFNGRSILVRFITREESADHTSSEQYFSDDGGHTWELNWINHYARVKV